MSKPAKKTEGGTGGEAGILHIETHIQFEDGEKYPFLLEQYMINSTVGQAKNAILKLEILKVGQVQPNDIAISLIMPGKNVGEASLEKDLDETKQMEDYLDDISCCSLIKLKRKTSDAAAFN